MLNKGLIKINMFRSRKNFYLICDFWTWCHIPLPITQFHEWIDIVSDQSYQKCLHLSCSRCFSVKAPLEIVLIIVLFSLVNVLCGVVSILSSSPIEHSSRWNVDGPDGVLAHTASAYYATGTLSTAPQLACLLQKSCLTSAKLLGDDDWFTATNYWFRLGRLSVCTCADLVWWYRDALRFNTFGWRFVFHWELGL